MPFKITIWKYPFLPLPQSFLSIQVDIALFCNKNKLFLLFSLSPSLKRRIVAALTTFSILSFRNPLLHFYQNQLILLLHFIKLRMSKIMITALRVSRPCLSSRHVIVCGELTKQIQCTTICPSVEKQTKVESCIRPTTSFKIWWWIWW